MLSEKLENEISYRLFLKSGTLLDLNIPSDYPTEYIWNKEPFQLSTLSNTSTTTKEHHIEEVKKSKEIENDRIDMKRTDLETGFKKSFSVTKADPRMNYEMERLEKVMKSGGLDVCFGSTKFGDCIEDEWFIVWLLRRLSEANPSNLVISLQDNDGDFLLIEAADHLPSEMQPETMENRVFLYNGQLHLLPQQYKGISLEKAIDVVFDQSIDTIASSAIQNAAFLRSMKYPNRARFLQHKVKIMVPHLVAHILHHCPGIIAHAVDAFYTRDERATRRIMEMKKFNPQSPLVPMTCTMTRLLYAQMKSVDFIPSSKFSLPPTYNPTYTATEMGIKITCGLEILYWNHSDVNGKELDTQAFAIFKEKLTSMGYFEGELEGSTLYQKLEKEAIESFNLQASKANSKYLIPEFLRYSNCVDDLVPVSRVCQVAPDSDDWLSISPDDVDQLVDGVNQNMDFSSSDDDMSELGEEEEKELRDLETMVDGVGSFIGKESGIRGALLPEDVDSDLEDQESIISSSSDESSVVPLTFNAEVFLEKLKDQCTRGQAKEPELPVTMDSFMEAMDKELEEANIDKEAFLKTADGDEIDSNANLLKHMISSVEAQQGLSGPASNMIGSLGFSVPRAS